MVHTATKFSEDEEHDLVDEAEGRNGVSFLLTSDDDGKEEPKNKNQIKTHKTKKFLQEAWQKMPDSYEREPRPCGETASNKTIEGRNPIADKVDPHLSKRSHNGPWVKRKRSCCAKTAVKSQPTNR